MVEPKLDKKASLEPVVKELFAKHTIPELRALLKRTRYDIEGKRHELRTVIGESYNSLIEAADSIICMRSVGFELSESVKSIEKYSNLEYLKEKNTGVHESSSQETEKQKQQLYSTAAQIKLLVDIPEQIWHGIETFKFLSASLLYLIACLVYDSLQKGEDIENINVETIFPVVQKQWNAINYFKTKITRRATAYLHRSDTGEKNVVETLLALLLLDNSLSVEELFQKLLDTRKEAINEILKHPPTNDQEVRDQLLEILMIIKETVHQVTAIFFDDQNAVDKPLLYSYVQHLVDGYHFHESTSLPIRETSTLSNLVKAKPNMHILIRHLPPSLQSYRPTLNPSDYELKFSILQTRLEAWLDEVIRISANITQSLLIDFVTSVKSAENIRREIWEAIENEEAVDSTSTSGWDKICQDILGKEFLIWDQVYRQAFNRLFHEVVTRNCNALANQPELLIDHLIETMGNEMNIGKFVWESIQFDTHQNEAGLKTMIHQSLYTYTPVVNRVKSAFEFILFELQEDLSDTLSWSSKHCPGESDRFWRARDAVKLAEHFAHSLAEALTKYREGLSALLGRLLDSKSSPTKKAIDQCLAIARISRTVSLSFFEHIRGIPQEFFATEDHRKQLNDEAQKLGQELYERAYAPWIECVVQKVERTVQGKLGLPGWIDSVEQRHCWEVVQASPNSPSIPQTQALVPTHVSGWILEILFDISKELTRVGNFITDKNVTQILMVEVAQTFFNAFSVYFNSDHQIPDSIALQLLLDMYYLNQTFAHSLQKQSLDPSNPIDKAEAMLVPNLSPSVKLALQMNSEEYFAQTGLLLSSLPFVKVTKARTQSSRRGSIGSGDFQYHHSLPINSPASRFSLLPIGQKLGRLNKPRV